MLRTMQLTKLILSKLFKITNILVKVEALQNIKVNRYDSLKTQVSNQIFNNQAKT